MQKHLRTQILTPEGQYQQWATRQPSDSIDDFVKPRRVFQPLYGESGDFAYLSDKVNHLEEELAALKEKSGDFAYLSDKVNHLEEELAALKEKTVYGKLQHAKAFFNSHLSPSIYLNHAKSVITIAKFWFNNKLAEAQNIKITSVEKPDSIDYGYDSCNEIYTPPITKIHKKNCPHRNKHS